MQPHARPHLSFANVVSVLALVVALSGGAYAATLPKNSVGAKQIAKNAVGASELKQGAVRSTDVKDGALTSADLQAGVVPAAARITYRRADTGLKAQGEYARITVGCQPGERIVGGGAGWPQGGGPGQYDEFQQVATSGPGILVPNTIHKARALNVGEVPDVWYASGYQGEVNPHTLAVYAICSMP